MSWTLSRQGDVVIATMCSNPVNKMNPGFFDDLNEALDILDREHPGCSLVLTAEGRTFSAGLDFEDVFPRFARGDQDEIASWFRAFRGALLRVLTLPVRTVAAVNGNAFAGGLILVACCDWRVGVEGRGRFALNEVPIGIPMPGTYVEILRYAVGSTVAADTTLSGRVFGAEEAREKGYFHALVPQDALLEVAVKEAARMTPDSAPAYATSKQILQGPMLKRFERIDGLDLKAIRTVMHPSSVRAQAAALEKLKGAHR
ncbi:MAG: enoyl-CoA hydratase/isomerase family protein [Alphaproteobacteria bacterium]|nr:enoyl-CoA hydratase/isomerase family protein [Alphaproteobacteria bacterium]